ncbi:MAG: 2-isopropylmalate synthase [Deltaproteobacteria bacterium]|nr:2-isopropylmalate synthase [Deltaproteobacteria bacterium]MCB9490272.1 2-isopropylmalate synthase [Deltaproteobacteria bacterium]
MDEKNRVRFFDTTLRDGEQSPGINLNASEKLEIAEQLARLRVDIIEAGFPIASEGDFKAVEAIARKVKGPVICGLARANEADIVACGNAIKDAERGRIHTFISSSKTHMQHQLRMNEAQVLELAVKSVRHAKAFTDDVEFSAMDATRSDVEFLIRLFSAAVEAGATTLNVPDTVGYTMPDEYAELIRTLRAKVTGGDDVIWSVHCHDDLGLATANTLSAVKAGARQVEVAMNGIGERAGNAALEEVVMAIETRRDLLGVVTGLELRHIGDTSRKVSKLTGYRVPRNKAIVGANAFMHESGIHQDGVLKERSTYEIMKPETVGHSTDNIYLGKHSGRHAFQVKLQGMGIDLTPDELGRAFKKFKDLADQKKVVTDEEIEAIVLLDKGTVSDQFHLVSFQSFGGPSVIPMAAVRVQKGDELIEQTGSGDGQVDALCDAINKATDFHGRLTRYEVSATTEGTDSLGEVFVMVAEGGSSMTGRSVAADVIEASALAYLNAINRLLQKRALKKDSKTNSELMRSNPMQADPEPVSVGGERGVSGEGKGLAGSK